MIIVGASWRNFDSGLRQTASLPISTLKYQWVLKYPKISLNRIVK